MDPLAALYRISRLMSSYDEPLIATTSRLGTSIGVSQQTTSRYLKNLESAGFITRRSTGTGQEIALTKKAINSLREMHSDLEMLLTKKPVFIDGTVVSGFEEGAYYVQQYLEIEKKLGFKPFPGTLNVKTLIPMNLERYATITIDSFKMGDRTFGEIGLFPVELHRNKKRVSCYLILPKRTHHREVLELISSENLRKRLKIKDGDVVRVRVS